MKKLIIRAIFVMLAAGVFGMGVCFAEGVIEEIPGQGYDDTSEIEEAFKEQTVAEAFRNCESVAELDMLICEHADKIGAEEYLSLDDSERYDVCRYMITYNLTGCYSYADINALFERAFDKVRHDSSSSNTSGGSAGDPSGKFDCYITGADGSKLTEMPEMGETVKVHIKAAYNDEPSAVYTVGIFDAQGRLVRLEVFTPSAAERYYPEFFEFEAEYDPDARVRIFTFEGMDNLKPLYKDSLFSLDNTEIPEEEPEVDGVVAVRGRIDTITPDYFVIECSQKRAFGYWNGIDRGEKIRVNGGYVLDYTNENAVYTLKYENGEYTLLSVDGSDEILCFSEADGYDGARILIEGQAYEIAPDCDMRFYRGRDVTVCESLSELCSRGEYFTAVIKGGKIAGLYGAECIIERVAALGGGKLVTESGAEYDMTDGGIQPGDVVMFYYGYQPYMEKSVGIAATFFEEQTIDEDGEYNYEIYAVADGKKYEIRAYSLPGLLNGEDFIAYPDPGGRYVKYAEKNLSSYETELMTEINGNYFVTTDTRIEMSDNVMLDGVYKSAMEAADILGTDCPCPVRYRAADGAVSIDTFSRDRFTGRYSETTGSIGEYILNSDTKIVVDTESGFEEDVTLQHNSYYDVSVYIDENNSPVYVVLNAPEGLTLVKEMIVSNVSDGIVSGYSDGEYISFETTDYFYPGDVLDITYRNGAVTNIEVVFSPLNCYGDYKDGDIVFARVKDIKENVISLYGETFLADKYTNIYIYDAESDSAVSAELDDIVFGPGYEYNGRVMVQWGADNSIRNLLIINDF